MRLGKTERARAALENAKSAGLDLRERRILILADGKRTREELIAMLGADCDARVDRLVRDGYLAASVEDVPRTTPASMTSRLAPSVPPATPAVTLHAPAPAPSPAAPASSRRTLVAAKMYLVDMLQLQRTPAAAELRLALQRTSDPVAMVERMADALAYLLAVAQPSYGDRVRSRVCEVVPEEWVPRFAHLGRVPTPIASTA